MITGVLHLLLAAPAHGARPWDQLDEPTGWSRLAERDTDVGRIRVALRRLDGADCVQGALRTDVPLARLVEVVDDVPSAVRWNSAGLSASEVVGRGEGWMDVYQYMPIPDWTLVADRWWVLRGWSDAPKTGGARFRWERVDAEEAYPALAERLAVKGDNLEIAVNWGEWVFVPVQGTTLDVRYRVCTDIGGSLPRWIQRLATQRTLPDTIVDLVREAWRRERGGASP
jgi:hypothetical protein